ncbi:glycine--tRNA ligase subunit beta [Paratissierella segnis]|jgi:glycyl-tRNA synthetase beta chain|uniref:Glycine--tRNA ligase beta subunit n=1 Tax=Paratissierella segnis TaxID=2763679 RepID=A0A926EUA2_9FIRM|nr:glycine--tRNA ligase subunit beta [Paratissierella segnis]MBC8588368.1 glycine--tRNA ligase subunit beta [Paratissierella segnis]
MSKYLLEIGVEEIPANVIHDTINQIKNISNDLLKKDRLIYTDLEVYTTPRRLILTINGIKNMQESIEEKVKGPSVKIAYDSEGKPSKALMGFMKGHDIDENSLTVEKINGEDYIYALIKKMNKSIEEILSNDMPALIRSISFPKSMKWGGKNLKFVRPIRWLVSLLDDKVIPFNLEGIKASNITRGHRFLGSSHIVIDNVDDYAKLLRENYVIIDQNERKELIKYGSERLVREKGGTILLDEDLLDEVTNIVEYPTPIIGRIKDEYLSLPMDVVITPMKEHLRYFPVVDDKKRLLPYFITVRNGDDRYIDIVVKGNEKVLGARLEDAKFFYKEDIKYPLEKYVERLNNITFQEKLGTLYQKTKRIQKLSCKIGNYLEVGDETVKNVDRAAFLSKADLVTKIVSEFTELQGKMGMEYAKISNENEIVSIAIFEQYLPRYSGDQLPSTTAGSILSIADKLDSIAGLFAIGIQPSGSQDPFGLRRSALGIINIILDKKWNISLNEIVDFALYIYVEENGLAFDYNKIKSDIMGFFIARIRNMFMDMNIRHDIIEAVVSTNIDDIYDLKIRAIKLNEWLKKDGLQDILTAFNRVSTLAVKAPSNEIKRDLLTEDELNLYDSYNNIEEKVLNLIEKKEYDKALDLLITLKDPIDNFFEKVMVMVEDETLKNNRLGLLKTIYDTMMKVCDLSKINKL